MNTYLILKWLHVISSTVLFGTGAGIAFFFLRAQRSRDVRVIAAVAREVVRADLLFTAMAVLLQPVTGFALLLQMGYPLWTSWIVASLVLYVLIGACWLPVVWLQVRMRDIAAHCASQGVALPVLYFQYYRWWFALGWPAFLGVLVVFYLMVAKPVLWTVGS
ncbi:MAG: DUF2269 family protein [Steroidobacteraceae bacterium]